MGLKEDGKKELTGIHDKVRESKRSWTGFLQHLKAKGLIIEPSVAVGDGGLGFLLGGIRRSSPKMPL
jgi:putative transposase